jgi:dTDP-4-dehydrorhamnose reductase
MVFDGAKNTPYVESDPVGPLCVYGRSKAEAERRARMLLPDALFIRTSAFFGPWDDENFVTRGLRALDAGLPFVEAGDSHITPAYLPDLVHAALDLLADAESGIWHLGNPGDVTRAGLVRRAALRAGLDASAVEEWPLSDMRLCARRSVNSTLASERGSLLPPLEDALARFVRDAAPQWRDKGREELVSLFGIPGTVGVGGHPAVDGSPIVAMQNKGVTAHTAAQQQHGPKYPPGLLGYAPRRGVGFSG